LCITWTRNTIHRLYRGRRATNDGRGLYTVIDR